MFVQLQLFWASWVYKQWSITLVTIHLKYATWFMQTYPWKEPGIATGTKCGGRATSRARDKDRMILDYKICFNYQLPTRHNLKPFEVVNGRGADSLTDGSFHHKSARMHRSAEALLKMPTVLGTWLLGMQERALILFVLFMLHLTHYLFLLL